MLGLDSVPMRLTVADAFADLEKITQADLREDHVPIPDGSLKDQIERALGSGEEVWPCVVRESR